MRYFRKMLFAFVAVAMAYTILLDAIFFISYRRSAERDYDRSVDAVFQQAVDFTDYQLRSVQELGMLLRSTDSMSKYLNENLSSPDRYTRFQLYRFVNSIYGVASSKKRGIAVTKLVDDYAILHNTTGDIQHMLDQLSITRTQFDEAVEAFSGQIGQPLRLIISTDGAGQSLYTLITRQWIGRIHPFYLLVSFGEDQLFSMDRSFGGTLAVFYSGELWMHFGAMDQSALRAALSDEQAGFVRREQASSIAGFHYVYLAEPPAAIHTTSVLIVLAGLAALAFSFVLMLLITRRMYSPIADTLTITGTDAVLGDEFEGIQRTFDSLNANVQTISRSLAQYYDAVENKFFHDLLTGLIPCQEIPERLRKLGVTAADGPFIAVQVRFEETNEPGIDAGHNIIYEVRSALDRAIKDSRGLYRAVDINLMTQAFIFRQGDVHALQEQLRGILLSVEPEYGLEITACIGPACEELAEVRHSFRQAARLAEQSEYSALKSKVIVAGDAVHASGKMQSVYYPLNVEQSLINAVIHGKTTALHSVIADLISTNRTGYSENLAPLSLMLTATVNRILDGMDQRIEDIFEEDTIIYLEFRSCADYDALGHKAIDIFMKLSEHMAQEAKRSSRAIERQMTDFIEENYVRDISLFDLADHVNMSRNYVSSLFKSSTGKTFKEYLSELRHRKACGIIEEEPNVKLRDVAERVGCSPDTLLRLFMRFSGISPSEYQQSIRNERMK